MRGYEYARVANARKWAVVFRLTANCTMARWYEVPCAFCDVPSHAYVRTFGIAAASDARGQ